MNLESIVKILELCDCHHIIIHNNYISAGLPDGDNITSICIYTDTTNYNTEIFTRGEYQKWQYRDIISLVQFIKNYTFPKAMKYICDICGINYYNNIQEEEKIPACLSFLAFVESGYRTKAEDRLLPISDNILNQFIPLPAKKWMNEGVNIETQKRFRIGIDVFSERIIIPIFDETSILVGVKGRIIDDNKIQDNKYTYLYPCPKNQILYGLNLTEEYAKKENNVFIFESEKSVMKMYSNGRKNSVALGGKILSDRQAEILQRLDVPMTICLDADVREEEINCLIEKLKYPVQSRQISVLRDPLKLLKEKDSPCDNYETFEILLNKYKEII